MDTADIIAIASEASFGKPRLNNVLRAVVVEAIVSTALGKDWEWCSADWAMCDFRHADGTRLEVKQSAARQSWHRADAAPSRAVFDIAARKQAWDGQKWVNSAGRNADIYLFAHHPRTDDVCDHRDPEQWRFYLVPTCKLPLTKTVSLSWVMQNAPGCGYGELAEAIETARLNFQSRMPAPSKEQRLPHCP
jgi:hypothetical protein